jgi:hypothetical protein
LRWLLDRLKNFKLGFVMKLREIWFSLRLSYVDYYVDYSRRKWERNNGENWKRTCILLMKVSAKAKKNKGLNSIHLINYEFYPFKYFGQVRSLLICDLLICELV